MKDENGEGEKRELQNMIWGLRKRVLDVGFVS